MRKVRLAAIAAVAATWLAAPPPAFADGCLQKFSCQLYGECRLPCLDAIMGTAPTPAAALDTQPTASLPTREGKAVAKDVAGADEPVRARHKLARREPRGMPRQTAGLAVPHLVAAREVTSLDQLAGKPVSFGPAGSQAQEMGRRLFARLDIKVRETPLDVDNALDGVATGDVAALLVVKPKDVARVEALPSPGVHELAVPDGKVAQAAGPAVARDDKRGNPGRPNAD